MVSANFLCKSAAAEGTVLLKNSKNILPLAQSTKIAVFGRMQTSYYRSGTGSGGGVYLEKLPCIIDSLLECKSLVVDKALVNIYCEWVKENPFNDGGGVWAGEPWHQEEMELCDEVVESASNRNDVALIIIGRTAGEDHDNQNVEGSYKLTPLEEDMISKVCKYFDNVIVVLNTGNIVDLSFEDKYNVSAILYVWHGGMQGANALVELLCGNLYPSGKLSNTQLITLDDHPADITFHENNRIYYTDDIYVGYRYFETFAKDKVRYPFGFGLGYTKFQVANTSSINADSIEIESIVTNIGSLPGKEVVQVYYSAPCNILGNPSRELVAFAKTRELKPKENQKLSFKIPKCKMASFDDTGETGNKSCYVLEEGKYSIYVGTDVRNAEFVCSFENANTVVTEKLSSAMAPCVDFEVIKHVSHNDAVNISQRYIFGKERSNPYEPVLSNLSTIDYIGNKDIKLVDVANNKASIDDFLSQLSDIDLAALVCGEGMSSPKATPGAAGAFGGQTKTLSDYGIPVCVVADGPSGIKLAKGVPTTLLPNGTLLACTWNTNLVLDLYSHISAELKQHEVDSLLGPGLNIHRTPLCGRNFEYFSEDPYLSGQIGAFITKGIAKYGCFSTIKHFCCNNLEKARAEYDVVVSERALREIYLKPFEIAVKEGSNVLIMTSYNAVNGFWSASNFDLTSTILRNEWGFQNLVMTDWWAKCNTSQCAAGSKDQLEAMVWSINDLYMVCEDALVKSNLILKALSEGRLTREQLLIPCKNILNLIIRTNTFKNYVKRGCVPKYPIAISTDNMSVTYELANIVSDTQYDITARSGKNTAFVFTVSNSLDSLAQIPITVKVDNSEFFITVNGTEGKSIEITRFLKTEWLNNKHKISISYSNAIKIERISIKQ